MKICEILKEDKIIADFSGNDKEEVINQLIDLFKDDERIHNLEKVRTAVLEREKIMSTGVGNGFAIPHGKTDGVNDIIAGFARIPKPIDFQALDDQPVNLVFLLVGKENLVGPHIKLLSRISRMMNKEQFRNDLINADTPAKIYEIFLNEEKNYFDIT
jgi:fructose-specific phosphotransferase system IIA component